MGDNEGRKVMLEKISIVILSFFIIAIASFLFIRSVSALEIGDSAPEFELQGSDGSTYSLSDMRGEWVVIAWFPKAFTGG